ncbi:hypothetical protein ACFQZ4_34065 [Catellatospora coxensis]|uniref:Uncharacterized protein n=1 Tax=Catellatospora coxensis TaxID=310354 RepID=A0A8J3P5B3_9ACTN|nr:hypothetical protein [Catellatospora coxensis]GIG04279.1 hypothetical protein Cco03nite_09790 [Catellatospora coxensis]
MRLRALVDEVRLGPLNHRVLRPYRTLPRAALFPAGADRRPHCLLMYTDRTAAAVLHAAWALATISPHSLVYLPMRAAPPPAHTPFAGTGAASFDLLLHHRLQFPLSRWKQVRARLRGGTPHTAVIPPGVLPAYEDVDHDARGYVEQRDHLRIELSGRTVFVVGGTVAFRGWGHCLRRLAEGPRPGTGGSCGAPHHCVSVDDWRPRQDRDWTDLHIEVVADWRHGAVTG